MDNKRLNDQTMSKILSFMAPGTPIREGIENVLRANTGGLIVVGYNEKVKNIVDGGFQINCSFSPSYLYELSKMDGAIILNETGNKILIANAQLTPDTSIPSSETGMRHRTAERVAKQTGNLVIAISQRRHVITLYHGHLQYALRDIGVILTKANQALQTLEKYKVVLEQSVTNLSLLEFEEIVTFNDILQVIQRFRMVLRIKNELLTYLNELGTEGRLIRLQMNELLSDMERELKLFIKDYAHSRTINVSEAVQTLHELSHVEAIEDQALLRQLGYQGYIHLDELKCPRGYRMLSKISRLPPIIIENLIDQFGQLPFIIKATVDDLDEVEGIGEVRARKIKEGLKFFRDQLFADRRV
ncbi:DNA integrity scanning diadenylate cyclase DisA [Niallia sp. XMNu-256]|uniref:DNA integrity scanning diadenylate cyclase DisA n=1 Tax=Niallia sp. XMNu-256 TaxID=3082444 RepID=UPI0030CF0814